MKFTDQIPTDDLDHVLEQTEFEGINNYLSSYSEDLVSEERPFSSYLRALLSRKGLTQREVFERAELSDRYGYRLLTQEKHTRQRDYILRLCFAAELSLQETQRALKLYGMSELYSKIPRDAVLMIALNRELFDIEKVNALLISHDLTPLRSVSYTD